MGRGRPAPGSLRNTDHPGSDPNWSVFLGEALPRGFYERSTLAVARDLLGRVLLHETREGTAAVRIVETEAYCGIRDRGCHTFGGRRTPRTEVMWGPPGRAYVYFTYGMHFCLNTVTREEGRPEAVLLRAGAPLAGIELMRKRRRGRREIPAAHLARGPANLCRALGVGRDENGADLVTSRLRILPGIPVPSSAIRPTPRVGIPYAGPDVERPWRFTIRDEPAVSRPRP